MITERDKANIETERKLNALKKFHNDNKLPVPLYGKLKRHIQRSVLAQNFVGEERLLQDMPEDLRDEVIKITHGDL